LFVGYDLHITRAESWLDSETDPIPIEEWEAFATSRADFSVGSPGDPAVGQVPVYAWIAPGGTELALEWNDGGITVFGVPDSATARSLGPIARELRAQLQGDEGESYGPD
jgi:hypothetical protein